MLRLKQALADCKIHQKALVAATGFSKSQISQTLNFGKLPSDAEKFTNGIYGLISESQPLCGWLTEHKLAASQLFEDIPDPAQVRTIAESAGPHIALREALCNIIGRAVLDGGIGKGTAMRMARAMVLMSCAVPVGIAADAAAMLRNKEE